MKDRVRCPQTECRDADLGTSPVVRSGFFRRREDGRCIQRYLCRKCGRRFSSATHQPEYGQHKRRINQEVRALLCMKVSLRAIARHLEVSPRTIDRKLVFLAGRARAAMEAQRVEGLTHVQFDEMQSSIHTKCKPVAIPMAVDAETRMILALSVVSMPAQHPLSERAVAKYGPRADDRPEGVARVIGQIRGMLGPKAQISTDCAIHYPEVIQKVLPGIVHLATLSRRARSGGQGELKRGARDPLFPFNHTAAMTRDGVSRLVRRTWCNSKRMDRLEDHLHVYAHYHNTMRLPTLPDSVERSVV